MLIENTQPNARQVGSIYLIPGVNRLDKKAWDDQLRKGYKRSVDKLFKNGTLALLDDGKLTKELIEKTFKVDVLEDWLAEAKAGPTKGFLKAQIALMTT